jgi:hypothetical protein
MERYAAARRQEDLTMEPIDAVFDGIPATVRAVAHGTDPGKVVIPIGGALGGGLELDARDVPALVRQLGAAHVRALSTRSEFALSAVPYAHA